MKSPKFSFSFQRNEFQAQNQGSMKAYLAKNSSNKDLDVVFEAVGKQSNHDSTSKLTKSTSIRSIQLHQNLQSELAFQRLASSTFQQRNPQYPQQHSNTQCSPGRKLTSFKELRNERKISKTRQLLEGSDEKLRLRDQSNEAETERPRRKHVFKDLNQLRNQKKVEKQQQSELMSDNCSGTFRSENKDFGVYFSNRQPSPSEYDHQSQEQYSLYGRDQILDNNFLQQINNNGLKAPSILFQTGFRGNNSPECRLGSVLQKRENMHQKTNTQNFPNLQSQILKGNLYKSCSKQELVNSNGTLVFSQISTPINQARMSNGNPMQWQLQSNQQNQTEIRREDIQPKSCSSQNQTYNGISIKQVSYPKPFDCLSDINSSTVSPKRISCQLQSCNLFSLKNSNEKFRLTEVMRSEISTQTSQIQQQPKLKKSKKQDSIIEKYNSNARQSNKGENKEKKKQKQATSVYKPSKVSTQKSNTAVLAVNSDKLNTSKQGRALGSGDKNCSMTLAKSRNLEKQSELRRRSDVKQMGYPAKIVIKLNDIMEEFQEEQRSKVESERLKDSKVKVPISRERSNSGRKLSQYSESLPRKQSCSLNRKRMCSGLKQDQSWSNEISFPLSGILTPQSNCSISKIGNIARESQEFQKQNLSRSIRFNIANNLNRLHQNPRCGSNPRTGSQERKSTEQMFIEEMREKRKTYLFHNISSSLSKKPGMNLKDLKTDQVMGNHNNFKNCKIQEVDEGSTVGEIMSVQEQRWMKLKKISKNAQNTKENRKSTKHKCYNKKRWTQKMAERIKQQILKSHKTSHNCSSFQLAAALVEVPDEQRVLNEQPQFQNQICLPSSLVPKRFSGMPSNPQPKMMMFKGKEQDQAVPNGSILGGRESIHDSTKFFYDEMEGGQFVNKDNESSYFIDGYGSQQAKQD